MVYIRRVLLLIPLGCLGLVITGEGIQIRHTKLSVVDS